MTSTNETQSVTMTLTVAQAGTLYAIVNEKLYEMERMDQTNMPAFQALKQVEHVIQTGITQRVN